MTALVQLEHPTATAVPSRVVGDCAICDQPIDDPHDERHTLPCGLDVHPECCPCQS